MLDLGSGGGIDVILSAKRVGPTGIAWGLDMTDEMLALARANVAEAGVTNAHFLKGQIEDVPLPAGTVDVVISNCVINLSTDKPAVLPSSPACSRPRAGSDHQHRHRGQARGRRPRRAPLATAAASPAPSKASTAVEPRWCRVHPPFGRVHPRRSPTALHGAIVKATSPPSRTELPKLAAKKALLLARPAPARCG